MEENRYQKENKSMKNRKLLYTFLTAFLLLLQLGVCIYFGTQKQGFHQDEYYSFFSSNRTAGLYEPDRAWQSAEISILDPVR